MFSWSGFKKIIFFILSGLLGVFLLFMILASIFSGKIGMKAIETLQSSVHTEVRVDHASISFITFFPKAAIKLNNIYIAGLDNETLVQAENISFKVSLLSLFRSEVDLHTVAIKNGTIRIVKNKSGLWNYDIFKKDTTAQGTTYNLSINKAILEHCDVVYLDQKDSVNVSIFALKTVLSASISEQAFVIKGAGNTILDSLNIGKSTYFVDKPARFNVQLDGDLTNETYTFQESVIELAGTPFEINGKIHFQDKSSQYDLNILANQSDLAQIVQLLPMETSALYDQLDPKGKVDINIIYQGLSDQKNNPELLVDVTLFDGAMHSRKFETNMENVQANLHMEVKKWNTHYKFETQSGTLQGRPLQLSGEIDINSNSSYSINMNASLPLALTLSALGLEGIEKGSGDIQLEEIQIRYGPKYKAPNQGSISATKLKGKLYGHNFEIPTLAIRLDRDQLFVDTFSLDGFNSEISGSGISNNFMAGILSDKNMDHQYRFEAERLNLTELLSIFPEEEEEDSPISDYYPLLAGLDKGVYSLQFNLNEIRHRELNIDHLEGHIFMDVGNIQSEIKARIFEGEILADINGKLDNDLKLQGQLQGNGVSIQTLMEEAEEFDQDFITSQHLKGTLESKMLIDMSWDLEGNFKEQDLSVQAAMILTNGELIRLPMMEDFSTYVKVEDLRHIKFTKLHNLLEIRKGQLYIPEMFIQSNALNLTLAGTHSFENQMDYALQINAGQVMINRFKKSSGEQKPLKARQKGFFNLHYRISGFPDNLQFGSDKKLVVKMMKESDERRDKIRNTLIDHFGPLPIFFDSSMQELDFFGDEDLSKEQYIDF